MLQGRATAAWNEIADGRVGPLRFGSMAIIEILRISDFRILIDANRIATLFHVRNGG